MIENATINGPYVELRLLETRNIFIFCTHKNKKRICMHITIFYFEGTPIKNIQKRHKSYIYLQCFSNSYQNHNYTLLCWEESYCYPISSHQQTLSSLKDDSVSGSWKEVTAQCQRLFTPREKRWLTGRAYHLKPVCGDKLQNKVRKWRLCQRLMD